MKKRVIVGGTLEEAGERFLDAWRRAEGGEEVAPQDSVTFLAWSSLASVLTDKRHELLRHLRRQPASSIRALARDLGRDYKRVHGDMKALAAAGLVERDGRTWTADYDEIQTSIRLMPPAA